MADSWNTLPITIIQRVADWAYDDIPLTGNPINFEDVGNTQTSTLKTTYVNLPQNVNPKAAYIRVYKYHTPITLKPATNVIYPQQAVDGDFQYKTAGGNYYTNSSNFFTWTYEFEIYYLQYYDATNNEYVNGVQFSYTADRADVIKVITHNISVYQRAHGHYKIPSPFIQNDDHDIKIYLDSASIDHDTHTGYYWYDTMPTNVYRYGVINACNILGWDHNQNDDWDRVPASVWNPSGLSNFANGFHPYEQTGNGGNIIVGDYYNDDWCGEIINLFKPQDSSQSKPTSMCGLCGPSPDLVTGSNIGSGTYFMVKTVYNGKAFNPQTLTNAPGSWSGLKTIGAPIIGGEYSLYASGFGGSSETPFYGGAAVYYRITPGIVPNII